jgi:hypothetical protein
MISPAVVGLHVAFEADRCSFAWRHVAFTAEAAVDDRLRRTLSTAPAFTATVRSCR